VLAGPVALAEEAKAEEAMAFPIQAHLILAEVAVARAIHQASPRR